MDPITALGAISSVGAIASGAVKLARDLHSYYGKTKRAESDVRAIALEIEQSAGVLKKLSELVDGEQRASARYRELYPSMESSLRRCQELFAEIRTALSKVVRIVPTSRNKVEVIEFLNINHSIWPMKQQRIEILRGEMRQIRTELHLVVAVETYGVLLEDHQKRLEAEEEQLKAEDDQIITLDLEAKLAAQKYEMLKRRHEKRVINHGSRLIRTPQNGEDKIKRVQFPVKQHQLDQEVLVSTFIADASHYKQGNRPALSSDKEGRDSAPVLHTKYASESLIVIPDMKVDCESIPDSSGDSNSHHETDTEAESIVQIEPARSLILGSVDIVVEPSDEVGAEPPSTADDSPVSRSSLFNGEASSISNVTALQDTATDPSFLDGAIGSSNNANKDKNSDPQPNKTRRFIRRRNSVNIPETQHRTSTANQQQTLPGIHGNINIETAKTRPREVDEPSVAAKVITKPIESIELLEFCVSPQRYNLNTQETWIIQANTQDVSDGDRWRNVTATRALSTSATRKPRVLTRVAHRSNFLKEQLALTIQQQRHIAQLLEKLDKKAADAEQKGSWELEDLKLEPNGKSCNDITSIKIALRWQSREELTNVDGTSNDTGYEESGTEAVARSKLSLGRWHLLSVNKPEADELFTAKRSVEYPGHPKMTVQTNTGEFDTEREPQPEDFGIPGLLHRPTLWDRLRGRTGICKECVRIFKNEHIFRLSGKFRFCRRCSAQYSNKVEAWQKANDDWQKARDDWWNDVPAERSMKEKRGSHLNQNTQSSAKTGMSFASYQPSEKALQIMKNVTKGGSSAAHTHEKDPSWKEKRRDSKESSDDNEEETGYSESDED